MVFKCGSMHGVSDALMKSKTYGVMLWVDGMMNELNEETRKTKNQILLEMLKQGIQRS